MTEDGNSGYNGQTEPSCLLYFKLKSEQMILKVDKNKSTRTKTVGVGKQQKWDVVSCKIDV